MDDVGVEVPPRPLTASWSLRDGRVGELTDERRRGLARVYLGVDGSEQRERNATCRRALAALSIRGNQRTVIRLETHLTSDLALPVSALYRDGVPVGAARGCQQKFDETSRPRKPVHSPRGRGASRVAAVRRAPRVALVYSRGYGVCVVPSLADRYQTVSAVSERLRERGNPGRAAAADDHRALPTRAIGVATTGPRDRLRLRPRARRSRTRRPQAPRWSPERSLVCAPLVCALSRRAATASGHMARVEGLAMHHRA